MDKSKKPDLAYNEYDLITRHADMILKEEGEDHWLIEKGDNVIDVQEKIWNDESYVSDILNDNWELIIEVLQSHMNNVSKKYKYPGFWNAQVTGFGWRDQSGEIDVIEADDAEELLREILPKTENTFNIWFTRNGFKIQNFHHDSPTGEWYEVRHVNLKELHEWDEGYE